MSSRQNNFPDITKKFRGLNVHDKKKGKRLGLNDSETSDNAPATQSSSRSRGAGGGVVTNWKGEYARESSYQKAALKEIRSSLQPYAISAESVHSLALELNVDQTVAEDIAKSSATIEIARERLIQILTKKMKNEQQYQMANNSNQVRQIYTNHYKGTGEYHVPQQNVFHQPRDPHTRTHRGSPDGASLRAESPVGPYGHNGLSNKVAQVNNLRQKIATPDYDILPRKHQLDPTKITRQYIVAPDRTPATEPPAYPGSQATFSGSFTRTSLTSDNGNEPGIRAPTQYNSLPRPNHILNAGAVEPQYRRGQTPPPSMSYDRNAANGNSSVNAGIMPGHVQQMVQRMSPSGPPQDSLTFFRPSNSRPTNSRPQQNVAQITSSAIMQENHKPIIIGGTSTGNIGQTSVPANQTGARFTPSHPPPSYTVAQQFKSKQKELGQPAYALSDKASPYVTDISRQQPPKMNIHTSSRMSPAPYKEQQQWSDPINGALKGEINYALYTSPHQSAHSSSPQSSMSSGFQMTAEPCDVHYQTLTSPPILKPVSSQPVIRPQPMTVKVPTNCEAQSYVQWPHPHMLREPEPQLSDRNLQYHMNQGHYITDRDPPPYGESLSGSASLTSSDVTMSTYRDRESSFMSDEPLQLRKPNVADNYLNAVVTSGVNNPVVGKPPKGTEPAVQAARVTGNNSKRQHACSYSAVSAAKQHKPGSISGPTNQEPPQPSSEDLSPAEDPVDLKDKTVSLSPVPVRKSKKKTKSKQSSKRDEEYSGSDEEEEEEPERRSARVKMFSSDAYKFYMEQHIENVFKNCHSRESRRNQLEQEMLKMELPHPDQHHLREMLYQKESNYIRLKRGKIDLSMFTMIKPLGVGAFGKVFLAKKRTTGKLYAIKTLRKKDVLTRNQVAHVKAERDILSEADNDWVVKLYYTFQDKKFLYFVMDYIPGGDMMSLLIKKGIFEEPLAQFYTAELTLALESVHRMGFIHRDIKPDNILIDHDGHIKLTDFGLCTGFRWTHDSKYYQRGGHRQQDSMDFSNEWNKYGGSPLKTLDRRRIRDANRHIARSLVGTPNYIAPEVLRREGYTQLCDWWSVGVILYEMVVGQPPFNADTPEDTQLKVINWEKVLFFPDSARLRRHTKDLIRGLCCDQRDRLGSRGIEEIKQHPYFRNIDWSELRRTKALFVPKIRFAEDTSNFDTPDESLFNQSQAGTINNTLLRQGEHAFLEFTFRRFFDEDGRAYSSQHYSPENDMAIDEAAELAYSEDYQQSYCQPNGEWPQGGASGESGRTSRKDNSFYL